jgi:DNA (cytosine-5)-methyltransferase 1
MLRDARPVGIDLFAGAGGLSLGFEQAGFDIVAAVEVDPVHAAVHKFNFPECALLVQSVAELSGEEIRRAANLKDRRVDVVFGGAPCQGFSLIGHRALDDPRNSLVRDFVRLVKELDASYFVFENVKGLTLGAHRNFLIEVIEALEEANYIVTMPWCVLNSYHFGVPQDRERLFLMGAKKGLRLPSYPQPTSRPAGLECVGYLFEVPVGPSCRDALDDLPDADEFDILFETDCAKVEQWGVPSRYAERLRCLIPESWCFGYRRHWDCNLLTSSLRTMHSEISRQRFAEAKPGTIEPISRFFKLPPGGVSNTLRAGTDSARGAFTSPRPIHYRNPRCVTVREMARLHGFPDWFRFHGTKWHGARQIGNAVPPPLGRSIAYQIADAIGIEPKRPRRTVNLGEVDLLWYDPSEAARFWGVPAAIRRRDRKSGVRKRKQQEIELQRHDSGMPKLYARLER